MRQPGRLGLRWAALLLACASCRSDGLGDLTDLAEQPALPYSVLVTGGAFVASRDVAEDAEPLARTFRTTEVGDEAFALEELVRSLRSGRVFTRLDRHGGDQLPRDRLAELEGGTPQRDPALQAFLRRARQDGHDLLLVVERLQDGPIQARGVNGQWPITLAVWLMIGLGLVIPDHTYESRAELHLAIRDLQTGRTLEEVVLSGGPVDLSLIERTDMLGLIESIIVPPFWVGDDHVAVEDKVREIAVSRLLVAAARQLKSADVQSSVQLQLPARISLRPEARELQIEVDAAESISALRVQVDASPLDAELVREVERRLIASERQVGARWVSNASLPLPDGVRFAQVLVQTITGRVSSSTVSLR